MTTLRAATTLMVAACALAIALSVSGLPPEGLEGQVKRAQFEGSRLKLEVAATTVQLWPWPAELRSFSLVGTTLKAQTRFAPDGPSYRLVFSKPEPLLQLGIAARPSEPLVEGWMLNLTAERLERGTKTLMFKAGEWVRLEGWCLKVLEIRRPRPSPPGVAQEEETPRMDWVGVKAETCPMGI